MPNGKAPGEIKIEGEAKPAEELRRPTPDVEADFEALLKDYGVPEKAALIVTRHIADTGSDKVFERPMELLQKLAKFPRQIPPVTRKNILDHWIAQNKIPVPEEYEAEAEKPAEEIRRKGAKEEKEEAKYAVDTETGAIRVATTTDKTALTWDEAEKLSQKIEKKQEVKAKKEAEKGERKVAYVYDEERGVVRMAREGEIGGTLEQAKELKRMAGEGKGEGAGESPFITDAEGNWILNPKARVTGIELMALESIRRAQERGEAVDPEEVMEKTAQRFKLYREVFGGEGKGTPEWMADPAKFIEMVEKISGGGKGDEALKQQVASLEKTLAEMREERYKEQIDSQQKQIGTLANKVSELTDVVVDLKRPVTGRTEMDIIHEIAAEGIGLAKSELPGFRRDIKEALAGTALPGPKSERERQEAKTKLRQAVETDKDIEEIGRRIFFGEG